MQPPRIIALTGGIGGAKLSLGLARLLDADELAFVVNTGDDFEHLGLHIAPDVDTLVYTLAGEANAGTGWGRRGESWNFMEALRQLGGADWFQLGDRDLAMHVERSRRLAGGETLSEVTAALAGRLGVRHRILPMSDQPVRTRVVTAEGELDFQDYFVRRQCQPEVRGFRFAGASRARPPEPLLRWLASPRLDGVVLCPSNPFVSIDPLLAVPGLRAALAASTAPVIAVSPVVGGAAIKGPTVKMMNELGLAPSARWVAGHYRDCLDGFVIDLQDHDLEQEIGELGLATRLSQTVMHSLDDRVALARDCLAFLGELRPAQAARR